MNKSGTFIQKCRKAPTCVGLVHRRGALDAPAGDLFGRCGDTGWEFGLPAYSGLTRRSLATWGIARNVTLRRRRTPHLARAWTHSPVQLRTPRRLRHALAFQCARQRTVNICDRWGYGQGLVTVCFVGQNSGRDESTQSVSMWQLTPEAHLPHDGSPERHGATEWQRGSSSLEG